jgi:SAM-dependent methyltransferase
MPSLQENIASIAKFYATLASEFDDMSGFGSEQVEQMYAPLKEKYLAAFKDRDVLEVACGTGYWTTVLARTARSVFATDINPEQVEITRSKVQSFHNVRCQVASAYTLEAVPGDFSGAFAHFWWSHVPSQKLRSFLETLREHLQPGALVIFADSVAPPRYEAKRRVDEHGDTYEERTLRDGRRLETLKNFPAETDLRRALDGVADDIVYEEVAAMWVLSYRSRPKQRTCAIA